MAGALKWRSCSPDLLIVDTRWVQCFEQQPNKDKYQQKASTHEKQRLNDKFVLLLVYQPVGHSSSHGLALVDWQQIQ